MRSSCPEANPRPWSASPPVRIFFARLQERMDGGLPVFGTCAGLILLADRVSDDSLGGFERLGGLDITVVRNAYGRQRDSFTAPVDVSGLADPFDATFIRAPQILDVGSDTEVLACHNDRPVLVRQGNLWGRHLPPGVSTRSAGPCRFPPTPRCRGVTFESWPPRNLRPLTREALTPTIGSHRRSPAVRDSHR